MMFQIFKSNPHGRWTGRQWWVEAPTATAAIEQGRRNWPSKNTTDQFSAEPLTEEQIEEYYRKDAEADIRAAQRGRISLHRQRCADRLAAYHAKCGENLQRSLGQNVDRIGCTPAIQRVVDRMHEATQERINEAFRRA